MSIFCIFFLLASHKNSSPFLSFSDTLFFYYYISSFLRKTTLYSFFEGSFILLSQRIFFPFFFHPIAITFIKKKKRKSHPKTHTKIQFNSSPNTHNLPSTLAFYFSSVINFFFAARPFYFLILMRRKW